MSHIPEDILQKFMQMTGLSRKEAEKEFTKSIAEMTKGPVFKAQVPQKKGKRGPKPKYDEDNYPHYLPSDIIRKYTIRVALKDVTPAVWRKFECPSNITLRHLTELIISLMGWENKHLNHIITGKDTYYVPFYQYDSDLNYGVHYFQEEFTIADILTGKGKTVRLEYDFGDSWMHEIRLSSVIDYPDNEPHNIEFIDGSGACPPEDCGGVWGYQELLELHAKRKSRKRLTAEEKERLEWYFIDKDYDPEDFFDLECMDICDFFSEDDDDDTPIVSGGKSAIELSGMGEELPEGLEEVEPLKTSPIYDEVLSLAFRLRELEPWADLDDTDIYAIRLQDNTEMYIATMGNAGGMKDVQFYDGAESFQQYLSLLNAHGRMPFEVLDSHAWGDYISILFLNQGDGAMKPKLYPQIRQWADTHSVKINPNCGYPSLVHYRPHLHEFFMLNDEQGLLRLKEALEAVIWLGQQLIDTDDLTTIGFVDGRYPTNKGGKVVPLVVKTTEGYTIERTKLPGLITSYPSVTLPDSELLPLKALPKSGTIYCRLIHIPGFVAPNSDTDDTILDNLNPEDAFSVLTLLQVNKKDEDVNITEIGNMTDTFLEDILHRFISRQTKENHLPQRIITDHSHTEALLRNFCQILGIPLELKRTPIPQLADACQSLYDNF